MKLYIFFVYLSVSVAHAELDISGRISGGFIAERFQFPYQAGLLFKDAAGKISLCGGSLISKNYVLTAAHCLDGKESVEVHLGAVHVGESAHGNDAIFRKTFPKFNMKMHEKYDQKTLQNDIAVIDICGVNPVPGKVEIVKLLPQSLAKEQFVGSNGRVSGWGKYKDNINSPVLRFADLNITDLSVCQKIFYQPVTGSNVCAKGEENASICGGDAGDPLMIKSGKESYQLGIAAWGAISGCELGFPQVFMRVSSYMDWLEENTDILGCSCSPTWHFDL